MNHSVKGVAAALGAGSIAVVLAVPTSAQVGSSEPDGMSASSTARCDEYFTGKDREDCLAVMRRDEAQRITMMRGGDPSSGGASIGASSRLGSASAQSGRGDSAEHPHGEVQPVGARGR